MDKFTNTLGLSSLVYSLIPTNLPRLITRLSFQVLSDAHCFLTSRAGALLRNALLQLSALVEFVMILLLCFRSNCRLGTKNWVCTAESRLFWPRLELSALLSLCAANSAELRALPKCYGCCCSDYDLPPAKAALFWTLLNYYSSVCLLVDGSRPKSEALSFVAFLLH